MTDYQQKWAADHPGYFAEAQRKHRAAHPELAAKEAAHTAEWRAAHKDELKELKKKWRKNMSAEAKAASNKRVANWESKNKTRKEAFRIRRKFNLPTIDEAQRLVERRITEPCNACGTENLGGYSSHIDHCHKTEVIRGILCNHCNVTLGQVNDSTEHLQKLITYLEAHTK